MVTQRTTDTHVYFWGGIYSNFYRRQNKAYLFDAALWRGGPLVKFYHSEGYYMACKAMAFGDMIGTAHANGYAPSRFEMILSEYDPKLAKAHGRALARFDPVVWSRYDRAAMFRAIWAKFVQNLDLARALLETGERTLVEGSPLDKIWGVGLAWDDPRIEDETNWQGSNWLGEILMVVRGLLSTMDTHDIEQFDTFMADFS